MVTGSSSPLLRISREDLEKRIPILGSYRDEKANEFLEAVGMSLQRQFGVPGYPVKEIELEKTPTPRRKLTTLIALSKFVIADDSVPSGHILELEFCRNCGVPTALIFRGKKSSWMTRCFKIHSNDFEEFKCESFAEIDKTVSDIYGWVNRRIDETEKMMQE